MERYLWITLAMALGALFGGLITWLLFKYRPRMMKLAFWMQRNCTREEHQAMDRLLFHPFNHDAGDLNILARVIQRAPEDIKVLLRKAISDIRHLDGE